MWKIVISSRVNNLSIKEVIKRVEEMSEVLTRFLSNSKLYAHSIGVIEDSTPILQIPKKFPEDLKSNLVYKSGLMVTKAISIFKSPYETDTDIFLQIRYLREAFSLISKDCGALIELFDNDLNLSGTLKIKYEIPKPSEEVVMEVLLKAAPRLREFNKNARFYRPIRALISNRNWIKLESILYPERSYLFKD